MGFLGELSFIIFSRRSKDPGSLITIFRSKVLVAIFFTPFLVAFILSQHTHSFQ